MRIVPVQTASEVTHIGLHFSLTHSCSVCDPGNCSISITRELVRNANVLLHPRATGSNSGKMPSIFNKHNRKLQCMLKSENKFATNFNVHENYLGSLLNADSNSGGGVLRWGLGAHISNKFPGDVFYGPHYKCFLNRFFGKITQDAHKIWSPWHNPRS